MRLHFACGSQRMARWLAAIVMLPAAAVVWIDAGAAGGQPDALTAPVPPSTVGDDVMPDASSPWAEVTSAAPRRFAVVTESRTKRRRLYAKGDLAPSGRSPDQAFAVDEIEAAGVKIRDVRNQRLLRVVVGEALPGTAGRRLAGTTVLDGVDYCYISARGAIDPEPRVLQVRARRAVVAVDTPQRQAVAAAPPAGNARPAAAPEYTVQTQKRLDATVLGKVRIRGAGPDAYDISAADLRMAMDHGGQVLAEAWSAVRPVVSWGEGVSFRVQSAVADGVLGPKGFRVDSPNLAERAGIERGDVVLALNGQPIGGFGDLFRVYQQVKRDQRLSGPQRAHSTASA